MKLVALVLAFALTTAQALAQARQIVGWPPSAGSRIRVESPFLDKRRVGTLISAGDDSIVFNTSSVSNPVVLPTSRVTKMEVARGTHRNIGKGAVLGFLIVGGVSAALAAGSWSKEDAQVIPDFGRGGDAAIVGVSMGLIGAAVGAVIGLHSTDRWERVPLPSK